MTDPDFSPALRELLEDGALVRMLNLKDKEIEILKRLYHPLSTKEQYVEALIQLRSINAGENFQGNPL